jgi:hypothetical protein
MKRICKTNPGLVIYLSCTPRASAHLAALTPPAARRPRLPYLLSNPSIRGRIPDEAGKFSIQRRAGEVCIKSHLGSDLSDE